MALVEIDESELNSHRQVTQAMQNLLNNPKTRRKILEAQKELNPNMVIPELDAAEPLRAEYKSLSDQIASMAKIIEDDKAAREQEKTLSKLQKQWDSGRGKLRAAGYTDEGLAEVEKFMEEKGVADHEVAAAAYERLHPPVEPVRPVGGNRFDMLDARESSSDSMKALLENPDNEHALGSVINETLRSVRGR